MVIFEGEQNEHFYKEEQEVEIVAAALKDLSLKEELQEKHNLTIFQKDDSEYEMLNDEMDPHS